MNTNVKNIYEIVEEIKLKITDNQYKIIMDNLMILNEETDDDEETEDDEEVYDDEEQQIIKDLQQQIDFLNMYITNMRDENSKILFIKRLELLNDTLLKLT